MQRPTTGEAPAKAPEATRINRNAVRLPPRAMHAACAMSPHPTPRRDRMRMGLRPTLLKGLHVEVESKV